MRVKLFLADGGELEMDHVDADSVLELQKEIREGDDPFLTFDMDGATVLVARQHLVRIDFD